MGASSSSSSSSPEQKEEESIAASTISLPFIQSAFDSISSNPLDETFSIKIPKTVSSEPNPPPRNLPDLLSSLGPSISSLLFPDDKPTWLQFLRGFNRCCARKPASSSLNLLFRLYSETCRRAGIDCGLEFSSDGDDDKVAGSLTVPDLLMLLWLCWIMMRSCRVSPEGEEGDLVLPDLTHLVMSALMASGELGDEGNVWGCDVFGIERRMSSSKLHTWMVTTVPGLANCFSQYVQHRLKSRAAAKEPSIFVAGDTSPKDVLDTFLLTRGRAWALSLTLRTTSGDELMAASFSGTDSIRPDNFLYRSSLHGKGLNRFWSNIEGYHGSLLILISASSTIACESEDTVRRWVIGILTEQGFENKQTFYGDSGCLCSLSPVFCMFSPSGKEKNFMYSHLHPTMTIYEPNPKPVGLAFGGTVGNERIFIDEDFAKVIVRHHAMDKTYQHGSLFPGQGYLPVEASLLEVEVWGFGGKAAKERQDIYKKRESLFSEQRRKVDLKTMGNWEDSPEKMMMDMVTDPNRVRREDR